MDYDVTLNTSGATGNAASWASDSTYVIASLLAGASDTIQISLVVNTSFMGTAITNWAEISADSGDDGDSTPDAIDGNGTGEMAPDQENDQIAEDGTAGQDEDDHDQAAITIAQGFDLALKKVLATGQSSTVNAGIRLTFQ